MIEERRENRSPNWLTGGGEMGDRIRLFDWSTTPLGDVADWPQSLRSAVSILLPSKAQIALFWGAELITLYNDGYRQALASKHPWALGRPVRSVLSELWDVLQPLLSGVVTTGEAFWAKDYPFFVNRSGYTEETYFDVSYDPVRDESGDVGGVFCIVNETTGRVLGDRRLQLLSKLASETAQTKTVEAACQMAMQALATHPHDIPFALLYRLEPEGNLATLIETTGIDVETPASPVNIDLTNIADLWKLRQVNQTGQAIVLDDLALRFGVLPSGAWETPPTAAWIMPLTQAGQDWIAGFLILGINPHRAFEQEYREFFELVAGNVATAISNASAFEAERKRVETLAELDRAKTSFFSNVSHEFRTPLTLMLSPLEQTLTEFDGTLPQEARLQLEIVQRNGKRLLKLVNTLLDFSQIEAGKMQARFEPMDLATYTTELASLFQSVIEQAGLKLQVNCPPLPESIYVDREMWEKIVSNLLSNAFKFTLDGEIAVSLHSTARQVELTVRDTGIGIPMAELPRLFERFHRVEGTRGRTYEGTGIGLALVQELVHLHGGTISVESVLGQGSTFRVRLPMGAAHLPEEKLATDGSQTQDTSNTTSYVQEAFGWLPEEKNEEAWNRAEEPLSPASARILLVDDNADMRRYLHRILSQFYAVDVVGGGKAALAAIANRTPDLILSDVMMPEMDGFELLRQLRSNPQTHEIPILLLSARAGEEAAVEGLNAGADDYLVKPFSARELLARVAANVELGRSRQAAARRRIDAIVSSVPDFIYTFDLAGRFTYVNQPLLDLWQKTFAQVVGKNFFELDYPPELAARSQQQIQQVITTRQPLRDETPYTSAWGTRTYEYIFVPLFDAEGAVEAVAGTTRDITERKQAEAALQASEAKFRNMADNAPFMIWVTDPTGYCHYLSQSWYTYTGQTPEAALGFGWLNATHPDDRAYAEQTFLTANERQEKIWIEYRLRRQDGEYRACIDAASPWFDVNGEFQGYVGSVIDIHDRKLAEEALRASEQKYSAIFNQTFQLIGRLTPDGILLEVNQSALNSISAQLSDVYGKWFWDTPWWTHSADLQKQLQFEIAQAASGEFVRYEVQFPSASGALMTTDFSLKPVFNESGQVVMLIAEGHDITERKHAEAQRDALLMQAQAAREAAEQANRIKDEFLAVLSHELRSPLNPILGWSRLLKLGKLDATKTAEALNTIERNARLQSQLIEDLLDVSRILQGKLVLNVAPVALIPVIEAALETVRFAAEAKHIQIQTVFDLVGGQVSGDTGRLQQVLLNLLSNAVKFTSENGRVEVRLTQIGDAAQIQVIDTGKGIHPDFLPYVFEHFRQEDGATTRRFGGLGLGLAIVRQIVELHGGIVFAESAGENQGATFTVRLPLLKQSAESADDSRNALLTHDASLLTGLKVLVVDDEPDSRDFVAFVLEQAGANVIALSSAIEVLQSIPHIQPDLLVSDIGMPQMDGYMLIEFIRTQLPSPVCSVCAIALTAYAGEANQRQVLNAGFQKHLAKPIDPIELVATVSRLIAL